jgi:alkylation response protein AidB-like acyl-CoA dehydrogenase
VLIEELLSGSNVAFNMYPGLARGASEVIEYFGSPEQKALYCGRMFNGQWGGTMCLTEPHAGSDVGAARTTAKKNADGSYSITGTKIFISGGDQDITDNIVHMVLARTPDAPPGTKGLSLFIVPKFWVEPDGTVGARNGCVVTKVEHKMGLRGSATCELTLGDGVPCRGLLVGEVHDGIAQMFHVIEYARMAVGTKSMATLSTAFGNALDYARVRKQGPDLLRAADKNAPRVEIIRHPDVRRMLMLQKAFAEGLRAMILWTAHVQDQIELRGGFGKARDLDRLNDLLLPLIKGYASEKVYELLAMSLQCFGGSGYCQDYPIEQYIRDQKIDSLYEGTTHIQALDLIFRKIGRDGGQTLTMLLGEVGKTVEKMPAELAVEKAALAAGLSDMQAMMGAMMGKLGASPYHVGLQGNRLLFALAELVIGWRLCVGAQVAVGKLAGANDADRAFYRGKLASARFYVKSVLPNLAHARKLVEASDLDVMELPDESW